MSYQSLEFLLFSALCLLIYYLAGKKRQKYVLLAANVVFYCLAGIQYVPFLAAATISSYFSAKKIGCIYKDEKAKLKACADKDEKKAVREASKKAAARILHIDMVIVIGMLAVCKYTNFMIGNINAILGLFHAPQLTLLNMILPVGISFYTFMALSYVLDVYWKRYDAEERFLPVCLYLTYFPHIVQGPIDRFDDFRKQTENGVAFDQYRIIRGFELTLWGFFKKLVIADRLGIMVSTVYDKWDNYGGLMLIIATVLYSIQIYADFSGCIDIVAGVSECFGIELSQNFNHPYFAKSMAEFWRRWHVSLGNWFRDYVYYPVSMSDTVKKAKKYFKSKDNKRWEKLSATSIPIFCVWVVTGIWHGAAWQYVAWGMFHCILIVGSNIFEDFNNKVNEKLHVDTESFSHKLFQMGRTFFFCCVVRVFFRATSMPEAIQMFKMMITRFNPMGILYLKEDFPLKTSMYSLTLFKLGVNRRGVIFVTLAVFVLWMVDMFQEKMVIRDWLAKQSFLLRWIVVVGGVFVILIFGIYGPGYSASAFIYEKF